MAIEGGGGGVSKVKKLFMKLTQISEGVGVLKENPFDGRDMGILWNYTVKNLRCHAANISLEKRLQEKTSRKNLELESHRQFVVVINLLLPTPATSMAPDRTGPAVPSGPVIAIERGGPANWARAAPPYPPALACTLERTLQLRLTASHQQGKQQLPVMSHNA